MNAKSSWRPLFIGVVLALGTMSVSREAQSGTATANAVIAASIGAACSITPVTAPTIPYDPVIANATTPAAGQFTISYTCTVGSTPSITLDEGLNKLAATSTPAAPVRRMANGAALMLYNIYATTGNRTTGTPGSAWGTANTATLGGPTGSAQTVTAFVGIAAGQTTLTNGNYQDTVLMTVTF
jgi:spore coat protein U-like protein